MSMPDLLAPICQNIEQCKKFGVETHDAALNRKVILTTDICLLVTDYQMMSMACNHLGPSANKFCPKCYADNSDPFKIFDLRTRESTCRTLERLALVQDKVSLQKQTGGKWYENCLWDYMDLHSMFWGHIRFNKSLEKTIHKLFPKQQLPSKMANLTKFVIANKNKTDIGTFIPQYDKKQKILSDLCVKKLE